MPIYNSRQRYFLDSLYRSRRKRWDSPRDYNVEKGSTSLGCTGWRGKTTCDLGWMFEWEDHNIWVLGYVRELWIAIGSQFSLWTHRPSLGVACCWENWRSRAYYWEERPSYATSWWFFFINISVIIVLFLCMLLFKMLWMIFNNYSIIVVCVCMSFTWLFLSFRIHKLI